MLICEEGVVKNKIVLCMDWMIDGILKIPNDGKIIQRNVLLINL